MKPVLAIRQFATAGLESSLNVEVRDSIGQYIESLIWPFVTRRSRSVEWFSVKDFQRVKECFRAMAKRLSLLMSPDNFEQVYLKYWLDLSLCKVARSADLPPSSDQIRAAGPLFRGILKRWVDRAILKQDYSFIYSLQKGSKKMWPELGQAKWEAAIEKHRMYLTGAGKDGLYGTLRETPPSLLKVITMTAREVFEPQNVLPATKFLPTGGSCMQANRKSGGALSLVEPFDLRQYEMKGSQLGRLRNFSHSLEEWRKAEYAEAHRRACEQFIPDEEGMMPGTDVKAMLLPEPGKFRTLTLGNGHVNNALQPLQGLMVNAWKDREESTMRRDDLTNRVSEIERKSDLTATHWCSVDYESATDLLNKDASLAAFEGARGLPFSDLGLKSLFPGRIFYPSGSKDKPKYGKEWVMHKEGQLMGHVLSFPLLCVTNLAVYRCALITWAKEGRLGLPYTELTAVERAERARRGRVVKKQWSLVLVNGDDMLFKCEPSFYPIFLQVSSSCGFKTSQGKQYLSPCFAMINSQIFGKRGPSMTRLGYLNMTLVAGISLKNGESTALPTQITRDLNKMVQLTPWTASAVPRALKKFEKDWKGKRFQPNWYLPVHLGGLGLDPDLVYGSREFRITRTQRQMAAAFIASPELQLYRRMGNSLPIRLLKSEGAKYKMVVGDYTVPSEEVEDQSDPWMNRLSYAYRASLSHNPDLYTESDEVVFAKLKTDFRLKPMSIERIEDYRHARLVSTRTPVCPPLQGLPRLYADETREEFQRRGRDEGWAYQHW